MVASKGKDDYKLEDVVAEHKGKMEYVRLGSSGLRVSKICLGMMSYGDKRWQDWVLEEEEALPLIKAAYDVGINFFDTANVYSNRVSEEITGKAIKKYNLPRDEIVVATKVFGLVSDNFEKTQGVPMEELEKRHYANRRGLSRKHIFDSVDKSIERLGTYIDLLQIHRSDLANVDPVETMRALHDVVQSGKVRYIGASSMYAWQFCEMQYIAKLHDWTEFITMQNFYCASYREEEREMMPCLKKLGVASIPWSPLGGGILARPLKGPGITSRGKEPTEMEAKIVQAIQNIAEKKGVTMAQVANAWVLKNPVVASPILGISNARSLDDAVKSIFVKLTDEECKQIEELYAPRSIVGHT